MSFTRNLLKTRKKMTHLRIRVANFFYHAQLGLPDKVVQSKN